MERDKESNEQIMELTDGVGKLADLNDFKFRYYKNWRSTPLTIESLDLAVPLDPEKYGITVNESNLENYKNFFNKSYLESTDLTDDILTIKKPYCESVKFKFIDFGNKEDILNNISESFNIDDFAEIIFLSKYIGDYNITKYGKKLTFENAEKTLVLTRL